ncbi:cathepsin L-like [Babylonia areolata]|uniref:cathepsin L-like n=1 Tax=Babylonia areolata TaxID=304850 RepID=UPI003FD4260C
MRALLLVLAVGLACGLDLDAEWETFKNSFNKVYKDAEEELYRRKVWEYHLDFIQKHNLEADLGVHSYHVGINEYADMVSVQVFAPLCSLDVMRQGQCGSCWAFSTTGSLEGQTFKKTGKLTSLSEQNLVDCSKKQGNHGCEGGLMDQGFTYIKQNHGIDTESSYPYEGKDGRCRFNAANVGANDTGFVDIKSKSEPDLQSAVATVGPISVAIDASHMSFQLYSHGVYHSFLCSQNRLDHGVLAVGYGKYESKDYWLVKNSWGATWGLNGYIMMSRNRDNNCGIATQASYPTV